MKKCFIISTLLLLAAKGQSQNVGINGTGAAPDASAMLDISATNKGILIPRVALTATNAAGPVTAPANALLVYNTATAGAAPNNVTPGYYYWDGSVWVRLMTGNGTAWTTTGNAGTSAATNFIGTTDAVDLVVRTNNTERMRVDATGNVGIATTPTTASVLDMSSVTNKGVEFPNVALSSTNVATLAAPATGTMVYNTATAGAGATAVSPGYYYWDGASWISMNVGGQSSVSYFTTAGLAVSAGMGLTYATGFPVNVTVPANCTAFISADIGLGTSSAAAGGYTAADIVLVVDGGLMANGGYQRTITTNNTGVVGTMQYASLTQAVSLTAGTHSFGIAAAGTGIGNVGTLGGNNTSVLQGELTITIIKK